MTNLSLTTCVLTKQTRNFHKALKGLIRPFALKGSALPGSSLLLRKGYTNGSLSLRASEGWYAALASAALAYLSLDFLVFCLILKGSIKAIKAYF